MLETGPATGGRGGLRSARLVGIVAALTLLLGVGVGLGVRALRAHSAPASIVVSSRHGLDGEATWASGAQPAPPITTLRDQSGRPFSLASLHGRTVAVVFFDSHCHQECPLEGRALAAAERMLPRAARPVLVAVSVNPLDSAASARAAVRYWGLAEVAPWHWLMGDRPSLAPVWRSYHIFVAPHPVAGDITHTEAVYLIDRRGYERSAYLYPFATRRVAHDLRVLWRDPRGH